MSEERECAFCGKKKASFWSIRQGFCFCSKRCEQLWFEDTWNLRAFVAELPGPREPNISCPKCDNIMELSHFSRGKGKTSIDWCCKRCGAWMMFRWADKEVPE